MRLTQYLECKTRRTKRPEQALRSKEVYAHEKSFVYTKQRFERRAVDWVQRPGSSLARHYWNRRGGPIAETVRLYDWPIYSGWWIFSDTRWAPQRRRYLMPGLEAQRRLFGGAGVPRGDLRTARCSENGATERGGTNHLIRRNRPRRFRYRTEKQWSPTSHMGIRTSAGVLVPLANLGLEFMCDAILGNAQCVLPAYPARMDFYGQ